MRATTHPGAEKHVETSSSNEVMEAGKLKQKDPGARDKANQELGKSGLTVEDVAEQSAYENDESEVAEQAANSDRP